MKNKRYNDGVTIAVLIVTIIVMLIIIAISVDLGNDSVDQTIETQDLSEMLMVQHAILERYLEQQEADTTKYIEAEVQKEYFVGDKCDIEGNLDDGGQYYLLNNENGLKDLGITMGNGDEIVQSNFIVNYETGYVKKVGSSVKALETYAGGTESQTSDMIDPKEKTSYTNSL